MYNKYFCLINLIGLLLISTVKASCLEYGHSCWGAHGKRSGGGAVPVVRGGAGAIADAGAGAGDGSAAVNAAVADAGKILRSTSDLRSDELNISSEDSEPEVAAHKPIYENFDEMHALNNKRLASHDYKDEDANVGNAETSRSKQSRYLVKYFGKQFPKLRNSKESNYPAQRRWKNLPIFQFRHIPKNSFDSVDDDGSFYEFV